MTSFTDLGLSPKLLQGIETLGFETPTPVQSLVIPYALSKQGDFIALAQTGTGKTAAFGLPLLQLIQPGERGIQALILCPTRELCVQVAGDLENYSKFDHQYKVVAVYGGASITTQITQIKAGAQIVVATPGRLIDLIERKAAKLDQVKRVVLDEADEMLNMGFQEALEAILGAVTTRESIWLFSATMPDEVRRIAHNYMENPEELNAGGKNETNRNIVHQYYLCRADDRFNTLKRVVDANPGIYGLIFCRTKNETKEIAEQMIRDGYNADALHGDLAQGDRDRVMNRFRERNLQLLIATDVAARGIDVSDISHVINYGLPDEIETYTHRSGRTGRAGRTGVSISIVTPKYEEKIKLIARKSKAEFEKVMIPTGVEVCEKQLFHIIRNIHDQEVNNEAIEQYMPAIYDELKDLSKEELIKRFASVEFNRFLEYYRDARDINIYPKDGRRKQDAAAPARANMPGMTRLFVNIGAMDGISKKDFLTLLTQEIGIPSKSIGSIDMARTHLHFDIESGMVRTIMEEMKEFSLNGRRVRVDEATPRDEKPHFGGGGFSKFKENKGGKKPDFPKSAKKKR